MGEGDFAAQGFVYLNITHKSDYNAETGPREAINCRGGSDAIRKEAGRG